MARPTAPIVLNTGNVVGASVDRCWLVTGDADVTDLKGAGPTLGRVSSPAYADDPDVGPSFGGTGYCQGTADGAIMTASGYRIGCIFSRDSTKTASSGIEVLWSIGGDTEAILTGEWYAAIVIDDGTLGLAGSAAGKIYAIWKAQKYGTVAGRGGPVIAADTPYFVTYRLSTWSDLLSVNGTDYSGTGMGGGSWYGGGSYVNLGCRDSYNHTADQIIAADTHVACAWLDINGAAEVSDAQANTWSSDGWAMFTGGGGSMSKSSRQLLMGVG